MSESTPNGVTNELLKQVMELDHQIRKLRKERDDMFYIPARAEIIETMKQHGVNELLLMEKDETSGEWKRCRDAIMFFNEDYDPVFTYEYDDICYRIVRFGIIDDRLRMRLQEVYENPNGEWLQKPEESDWLPFQGFEDYELLFLLLHYVIWSKDIYEYTAAHPELLVLRKEEEETK